MYSDLFAYFSGVFAAFVGGYLLGVRLTSRRLDPVRDKLTALLETIAIGRLEDRERQFEETAK